MQRAPALCGVWGRVLVASLTNARRPRLEPGTFQSQAVRLYRLHEARPSSMLYTNKQNSEMDTQYYLHSISEPVPLCYLHQ